MFKKGNKLIAESKGIKLYDTPKGQTNEIFNVSEELIKDISHEIYESFKKDKVENLLDLAAEVIVNKKINKLLDLDKPQDAFVLGFLIARSHAAIKSTERMASTIDALKGLIS